MSFDLMKNELNLNQVSDCLIEQDVVKLIAFFDQWTSFLNDLAMQIYNEWRER